VCSSDLPPPPPEEGGGNAHAPLSGLEPEDDDPAEDGDLLLRGRSECRDAEDSRNRSASASRQKYGIGSLPPPSPAYPRHRVPPPAVSLDLGGVHDDDDEGGGEGAHHRSTGPHERYDVVHTHDDRGHRRGGKFSEWQERNEQEDEGGGLRAILEPQSAGDAEESVHDHTEGSGMYRGRGGHEPGDNRADYDEDLTDDGGAGNHRDSDVDVHASPYFSSVRSATKFRSGRSLAARRAPSFGQYPLRWRAIEKEDNASDVDADETDEDDDIMPYSAFA